jgi:hypothetical protein
MKPLHRLFVTSFKYALIMVSVFALYECIKKWQMIHYPEYDTNASTYGRLIHLITIFFVYLVIGYIVYYLFNVI